MPIFMMMSLRARTGPQRHLEPRPCLSRRPGGWIPLRGCRRVRSMADPLSHFDPAGAARMVTVTDKPETPRGAIARARVRMAVATLARIRGGAVGKGDVLGVARLAAIGGAKQTPALIPLCHPVRITGISVEFSLREDLPGVEVQVQVSAHDRTG